MAPTIAILYKKTEAVIGKCPFCTMHVYRSLYHDTDILTSRKMPWPCKNLLEVIVICQGLKMTNIQWCKFICCYSAKFKLLSAHSCMMDCTFLLKLKYHPLPYSVHQSSLLNCWLAGSGQGSEFFQVQGKAFFSQANGLYKLVDVDEACLLLHSYHLKNNVSSSASKVKITTTPILGLCMYLHISLQHLQSGHSCVDRWDWCYTQVGMVQFHYTPHCPREYYHFHFQSRLHGVVQHLQHKKEIHCNYWYGYDYVLIKINKTWNRAQWCFYLLIC